MFFFFNEQVRFLLTTVVFSLQKSEQILTELKN